MQLLFPIYIFSLALPTIKFMGAIKLCEIIGFFLIIIAIFQWRIKHFPKNSFIFFVLLISIISFSWLANSIDPVIYFNKDASTPGVFHLSRFIQLILCFGIFLVFSNIKYNEWIYLSKYYVNTFNLFCFFGIFFYILFLVFDIKSSFICCNSRLTSPYFSEPGPFGTILVSSIYVARSIRMRFSYFLQMTCLILTFSTLAWITYLVIIGFDIYVRNKKKFLYFTLLIVFSITSVPTLQKQVVNRVVQLISASREDTYYGGRYSGMIIAPNMIKENPFIGIGWQNYRYQRNIPKYLGEAYERDEGDTPSNGYLQMLAETGIIGFTIFMIFLWYLLKMGILKLKQLNAYQKGWTLAMLAMWFAMLSSSYLTFHHLWVTAGLSYATIFHYRRYEMDKE